MSGSAGPVPTGRRDRDGALAFDRRLDVPPSEAWAAVTDPGRTARWIGPWSGDASSGHVELTMTAEGDGPPSGVEIVECDAPRRLVVRTGPDGLPWLLALDLREDGGGTVVTLTHAVEGPDAAAVIGPGWEFYLDRLVAAETGGDVDAIAFEPGYVPGQSGYYRSLFD